MAKKELKPDETYDREHGIKAIIALQLSVGINEPPELAGMNWDSMGNTARLQTTLAHKAICGEFKETVDA